MTTKDSHTSLLRSRSHNRPTNRRNKPQLKATRKRNSRSKGLRQSAVPGADGPRCPGGQSARSRQTVREVAADDPKMKPEQPVLHLEIRTVRTLPSDGLRATRATRTVRKPQADGPQTPCNETQLVQQIEPRTCKNKR
jgi:hypothetical protein